jgi:hypothetical protein
VITTAHARTKSVSTFAASESSSAHSTSHWQGCTWLCLGGQCWSMSNHGRKCTCFEQVAPSPFYHYRATSAGPQGLSSTQQTQQQSGSLVKQHQGATIAQAMDAACCGCWQLQPKSSVEASRWQCQVVHQCPMPSTRNGATTVFGARREAPAPCLVPITRQHKRV